MLLLKLWNWIRGYVIIKVEGLALESFINESNSKGVSLWDIKRLNHTTLEGKVGIKDYKKLRKPMRKTGCKSKIHAKNGCPFWISKIKARKMLILGAFFSLTLLFILSSFIFLIEITGNDQVDRVDILNALNESGFKIGSNKYFINLREIENDLLLNIDELAWIGIEISGIMARIEVVEKTPPFKKIEKNIPCNVLASKNGIIEKVIARNGDAIAKKGDIVIKGDLLINGIIHREGMEVPIYTHAHGEVYARTYYEAEEAVNLITTKKIKTGEKSTNRILRMGNLELDLKLVDHSYKNFIVEETIKKIPIWRNITFPVEIVTRDIYEVVEKEERINLNRAKEILHVNLMENLLQEIPKGLEILNTNTEFTVKNNTLRASITIEVIEDIGIQKKIIAKED